LFPQRIASYISVRHGPSNRSARDRTQSYLLIFEKYNNLR
jgi:hypothetical protein